MLHCQSQAFCTWYIKCNEKIVLHRFAINCKISLLNYNEEMPFMNITESK